MNKVVLQVNRKRDDANFIYVWADKYEDLFEKSTKYCPMKAIKIIITYADDVLPDALSGVSHYQETITCIREENIVEILANTQSTQQSFKRKAIYRIGNEGEGPNKVNFFLMSCKYTATHRGKTVSKTIDVENLEKSTNEEKGIAEMCRYDFRLYLTIMALMIFGNEYDKPVVNNDNDKEKPQSNKNNKKKKTNKKKPLSEGITYIIKTSSGEPCIKRQGSHAKPSGQFGVRGHYRHYENGKVIWIKEYVKGKGKEVKNKTYKLKSNTLDNL